MEHCPDHGACAVTIKRLGEDVSELFNAKENQTKVIYELQGECKEMKKSQDEFYRRLKERDEELKVLTDLTHGVTNLGEKMEKVLNVQETHSKAIAILQAKPGEVALSLWKIVVSTILTTGVGIYVGMLIK